MKKKTDTDAEHTNITLETSVEVLSKTMNITHLNQPFESKNIRNAVAGIIL